MATELCLRLAGSCAPQGVQQSSEKHQALISFHPEYLILEPRCHSRYLRQDKKSL